MNEQTLSSAERRGAGAGFLSHPAALAFDPWLPHAHPRWRRHRHARGFRGARRRVRRAAAIIAVVLVLHAVFAVAWLGWTLALLASVIAGRRAFAALRARRLRRPPSAASAKPSELPRDTRAWLGLLQSELPAAADPVIARLLQRLDALAQQAKALAAPSEASDALRRLLGEELPELVEGYRRVPRALTRVSFQQRPSPERQLVEGLDLLDAQLGQLQQRLAEQDVNALAAHVQFLRLKYGEEPALSPPPHA